MTNVTQELGIQSWCFRHFKPLPAFLAELKKAGVTATELCGVHASFDNPDGFPDILRQFKEAGVKIHSIGVEHLGPDEARNRKRFEFVKAAGAKFMSVTFGPDGMWDVFRQAEKLADEFDIHLGIHNHGGYDWLGNTPILDYVFRKTSKRIGLTLDTAWALDAKQNPIQMIEKFADRLYGIHFKDFVYDKARNPADVVVGTGNIDLPKLLETLKKVNFSGFPVIEYEADVENPVPALSKCVAAIKKAG